MDRNDCAAQVGKWTGHICFWWQLSFTEQEQCLSGWLHNAWFYSHASAPSIVISSIGSVNYSGGGSKSYKTTIIIALPRIFGRDFVQSSCCRYIGGLYGRALGRLLVEVHGGIPQEKFWAWIDPGALALIGAASFFGGVSRLTMSLTVIMVSRRHPIYHTRLCVHHPVHVNNNETPKLSISGGLWEEPNGPPPNVQSCENRFHASFHRHRGLAIPTCITARAWRTCRDACRGP